MNLRAARHLRSDTSDDYVTHYLPIFFLWTWRRDAIVLFDYIHFFSFSHFLNFHFLCKKQYVVRKRHGIFRDLAGLGVGTRRSRGDHSTCCLILIILLIKIRSDFNNRRVIIFASLDSISLALHWHVAALTYA